MVVGDSTDSAFPLPCPLTCAFFSWTVSENPCQKQNFTAIKPVRVLQSLTFQEFVLLKYFISIWILILSEDLTILIMTGYCLRYGQMGSWIFFPTCDAWDNTKHELNFIHLGLFFYIITSLASYLKYNEDISLQLLNCCLTSNKNLPVVSLTHEAFPNLISMPNLPKATHGDTFLHSTAPWCLPCTPSFPPPWER